MQRAQPAEGGQWEIKIQAGPEQLAGDEQAGAKPHQPPDHGGDGKSANDTIVVTDGFKVHELFFCGGLGTDSFRRRSGSSSNRRMGGVHVSSYWPVCTAQ